MKLFFISLCLLLALFSKSQDRNVLFIIVDDLKPLIGAYGDEVAITPTIDSLSQFSTIFTNAHSQYSKCGPSRASFLTGMTNDVIEVWSTEEAVKLDRILTIPEHFKERGYVTAGIGKVFHGADQKDEIWTLPFIYDEDYVYNSGYRRPKSSEYQSQLREENENPSYEIVDIPDDAYRDGVVANLARGLIKKLAQADKPFLMTIGFRKPHLPLVAPKKYWDLYDPNCFDLAEIQDRPFWLYKYASHDSPELKRYSDIPEHVNNAGILDKKKQLELVHAYYACVSYIDTQIRTVMNELNSQGLQKNTIIVIVGDHGWHLGDHGMWTKTTNFEQATHVPMIIYSPDSQLSVVNSSPVGLIDIFPTLCQMVFGEVPEVLQGVSLDKIVCGESQRARNYVVSQINSGKNVGYSVRTDRYRFTEWHEIPFWINRLPILDGDYRVSFVESAEFYDYDFDRLESKNLVNDKRYQEMRFELGAYLMQYIAENKRQLNRFPRVSK